MLIQQLYNLWYHALHHSEPNREERLHTSIDELWKAYLSPPVGRDLEFFCNLFNDHDQRFPPGFLENFSMLFKALRGSHPIDTLPEHLLKIFKKVAWNQDLPWNPKADPQYLAPQSLMLKLFHHVRDKIKERERDHRRREKESLMKLKFDEATSLVVSLNNAIEDLWCAFLTPPLGHLRSLIAVLVNGDARFPNNFLDDFLEIFNHLCGFNTTGKEEYVKIFKGVEWNSHDDPDYKIPKSLMEDLFDDLFDDLVENLSADLEVEETVTAEQIEANIKRERRLKEDSAKNSVAFKKMAYHEGRLGRDVAKKETQLKIAANRMKNTGKNQKK